MNENQIKALKAKFETIDKQLGNLTRSISWLSLAVISLNKLAEKDHSKEEIQEALKDASKELAKIHLAMSGITTDTNEMWKRYFGRESMSENPPETFAG